MIIYDTGVLVAAERNERATWALHDAVLREGLTPVVPAGVLAQAWRGGPQASLSRLLAGCTVTPLDEDLARAAGTLCGRSGTNDVVDTSVVALAASLDAGVVTGDVEDLRRLAGAADLDLRLHGV